jgi:hypothetical protein
LQNLRRKIIPNCRGTDLEDDADNVRYDEARKTFYVGFGSGGIAVVDAVDGKQVGSIKVGRAPRSFSVGRKG